MKKTLLILKLSLVFTHAFSQEKSTEKKAYGEFFSPTLEIGYVRNPSKSLSDGLMIKTSIEYRLKQVNDFFFRANYDTYDVKYNLENLNNLSNIVKGTAYFSDLMAGVGYRFGKQKNRFTLLVQPGVKFYDFPVATNENNIITINQAGKSLFVNRITAGYEYYINSKSAFTIDVFGNMVGKKVDFWNEKRGAFGLSIGFTTAIM